MKSFIGNLLFFAALMLVIARFLSVWAGTPFPIDLVTSNSMSPSLMEGDVVAWTPTTIDEVEIGDVVVFKSYVHWPGEKIVVHRVSDIKKIQVTGEKILETKGDANEWLDQAGPHIPEPYIHDDHLMGKVVSIGQHPLKIPFIGYLGIWINQGFDMITQSSSSKESSSFIGIFAPLTISVVLMVVLLFILPEKAKTPKEKIRLNIFGHTPLNLKKTFVFFIIAYILFLSLIHCFAYDSTSASLGINADRETSAIDFGILQPGKESLKKNLDLVNPSAMPVKGIIFGKDEMGQYVETQTFELERGEFKTAKVQATIPVGAINGSYAGDVMVYSSPFWLIFSDDFIQNLLNWNPGTTVFVLDFLSAVILTSLTMFVLITITFVADKIATWGIDKSWRHSSKLILKKSVIKKMSSYKRKTSKAIDKNMWWVIKLDFADKHANESKFLTYGKPIIASLITLPVLFFISDQISAMIIAVFLTGVFAYFISCKIRRKIVLTVLIALVISVMHMAIQSNLIILSKEQTLMELMALSLGAVGIYLLIFTLALIPLALISWLIAHLIRNLKERKDPLLSLEGSCDL